MKTNYEIQEFLDQDSETFSYVIFDKQTKKSIVIDPVLDFDYKSGRTSEEGVEKIANYIKKNELNLEWVLETHAHADHISGAPFFKKVFGAKIGIGEHIKTVQKTFKTLFNLEKEFLPNGTQFDKLFKDGEIFHIGELTIRVMHTPGHTPADLAYLIDESVVFVGDTIFMPDVGNESRDYRHSVTVKEQKESNIHVNNSVIKEQFIEMRETRDKTLSMPRLILPAIQLNVRAGNFPPADNNGVSYLKVPLNQL